MKDDPTTAAPESFGRWLERRFPRAGDTVADDPEVHRALCVLHARETIGDSDDDGTPRRVNLTLCAAIPPPPREWIVDGWAHAGASILVSSHGGLGKSLLSAQLAVCVASGTPFLGLPVRRSRVLLLSTEDNRDELHRRLCDVAAFLAVDLAALEHGQWLDVFDATGRDAALFGRAYGLGDNGRPFALPDADVTPTYEWLRERIAQAASEVVIGDSLSDLFDGDEIRRRDVRRFMRYMVGLVMARRGCVFLIGHTDKASARRGGGGDIYSGSTAWHNSARQRWEMYTEARGDDETIVGDDDGRRILELAKNNYGPRGARVELTYNPEKHVFTGAANASVGGLVAEIRARTDRRWLLAQVAAAEAAGDPVHSSERANRNAHVRFSAESDLPRAFRGKPGRTAMFRELLKAKRDGLLSEAPHATKTRHRIAVWMLTATGRAELG